jgi:hypothetical protein
MIQKSKKICFCRPWIFFNVPRVELLFSIMSDSTLGHAEVSVADPFLLQSSEARPPPSQQKLRDKLLFMTHAELLGLIDQIASNNPGASVSNPECGKWVCVQISIVVIRSHTC